MYRTITIGKKTKRKDKLLKTNFYAPAAHAAQKRMRRDFQTIIPCPAKIARNEAPVCFRAGKKCRFSDTLEGLKPARD
jgi:hypothetical protein